MQLDLSLGDFHPPFLLPHIKRHKAAAFYFDEPQKSRVETILNAKNILPPHEVKILSDKIFTHLNEAQYESFRVKKNHKPYNMIRACHITFWIVFLNEGNRVHIQINIPKKLVGSGINKRIKSGFIIDLQAGEARDIVRLRPKNRLKWSKDAFTGFKLQKMFYEKLQNPRQGVRICDPPIQRVDMAGDSNLAVEYIQELYPYTFQKQSPGSGISIPPSLTDNLIICRDLFCTIGAMHKLGFVHRDIKPPNILLDANFKMHLNDFDICTSTLTTARFPYVYWDLATQKGLSNPYCDMIGGAICMLDALSSLYGSNKHFYSDHLHTELKHPNAVDRIIPQLKVGSASEKKAFIDVVQLACAVVQAEDRVLTFLLSSMANHFIKWTQPYKIPPFEGDLKGTFKDFSIVSIGLTLWTMNRLQDRQICLDDGTSFASYLEMNECPLCFFNIKEALKILTTLYAKNHTDNTNPLQSAIYSFYLNISDEVKGLLSEIVYDYNLYLNILCQAETARFIDLESCTEELFILLNSAESAERMKGFAILTAKAPSPQYVQESLQKIIDSL